MMNPHQKAIDHIGAVLKNLTDPVTGHPFLQTGRIEGLAIDKNRLSFALTIPKESLHVFEVFRKNLEETLRKDLPAYEVFVGLTCHKGKIEEKNPIQQKPQTSAASFEKFPLPFVKHVLAVGSGKGGVGKSTVSLNLAFALQKQGMKVGLLDMDLYGPSLAHMVGGGGPGSLSVPLSFDENKKIKPFEVEELFCMSMGFLIPEKDALIWRGPMLHKALKQLLVDVAWPDLDVLILDLPPGTGDVHLSLMQRIALKGAVIVSTPQDLALLDARRAMDMFQKMHIPLLGMVENMSSFTCPYCHETSAIFGSKGAEKEAHEKGIPFLGAIPLALDVRQASDEGKPFFVQADEKNQTRQAYMDIATKLRERIENP